MQETSIDTWGMKYQLKTKEGEVIDKTIYDSYKRVAEALSSVERSEELREFWRDKFLHAMLHGAIPAGRIMSNAGAEKHKAKTSTINCTVSATIEDSMDDILTKVHEAGITLKAGCGIGYEFSTLRPKGAFVSGAGSYTSGPISFMHIYDKMCLTISSAGARRGAQMGTFDISHPDVLEFIKAKREDGVLRQFNLSVLITDEFIKAVKDDSIWNFSFPMTKKEHADSGVSLNDPNEVEFRRVSVNGDYIKDVVGRTACRIHSNMKARNLWNIIMCSTYDYAEPGFILIDKVNKMNNNWFCEDIRATNPCITGDTKIAVYGRGAVPIKQLADEGQDVHVFCRNMLTGDTELSVGRNPRRTGVSHKVYKVTLDDGSHFKANASHSLYLRGCSNPVTVDTLKKGDSLIPFNMELDTDTCCVMVRSTDEPVLDFSLMRDLKIKERWVSGAHENTQNAATSGEYPVDDSSIKPNAISDIRTGADSGNVLNEYATTRTRGVSKYSKSEQDSIAQVAKLRIDVATRALKCGSMLLFKDIPIDKSTWDSNKQVIAHYAIDNNVVSAAWISYYWEDDWEQFIEECKSYNHKVVSVEYVGEEDVYNITVDTHHNYFIVTSEQNVDGKLKYSGILSKNCGEQPLPPYGACLLGSIDLTKFVRNPFSKDTCYFDFDAFRDVITVFTRMLDNVIEASGLPLAEQQAEIERKRRHGMGFMGLGSAMTLMCMKYGSKESLEFTSAVTEALAVTGFRAGVSLAKEKGAAPIMNEKFEIDEDLAKLKPELLFDFNLGDKVDGKVLIARYSQYMKAIGEKHPDIIEDIEKYGCRFTHHSSIAPTGTLALTFGNNISNGIEPSFSHKYSRNIIKPGQNTKEKIDVLSFELLAYREIVDKDADVGNLPDYFVEASDVTPKQHVDVQAASQFWVDSSISKTINVPTDINFDEFSDIYMYAYDKGLKGATTFRFNPEAFQGVLVKDEDLESTEYVFTMEDGTTLIAKGNDTIEYEGEEHSAANLFDAIKEGYYGKL